MEESSQGIKPPHISSFFQNLALPKGREVQLQAYMNQMESPYFVQNFLQLAIASSIQMTKSTISLN